MPARRPFVCVSIIILTVMTRRPPVMTFYFAGAVRSLGCFDERLVGIGSCNDQ